VRISGGSRQVKKDGREDMDTALQAASPIVLALQECDEELRAEAIELFKQ
jgi:hypothetical protein